ncbi:hypothetical protein GGX14DRAFT_571635 [Mycena pura]|uniref:Uncharacterized protein n=1 Tax=Mycena pura TaxID=153505 RepID=A0AAD6V350_9AGAR|nr:hypothetical protein GGX14DRAFT_571635 [Mycena pura]
MLATRTLTRRLPLPGTHRLLQLNATASPIPRASRHDAHTDDLQRVAAALESAILVERRQRKDFLDSLKSLQDRLNEARKREKALTAEARKREKALAAEARKREKVLAAEARKRDIASAVNAVQAAHVNEGLRVELERARNNLNLRTAIEIITTTLVQQHGYEKIPEFVNGLGVQPVIDAVVEGHFNNAGAKFNDAQATVTAGLMPHGGIEAYDIGSALSSLYSELSTHYHGGVSKVLTVRHGEQTLAEAIATMSIVLFARQQYASRFDAQYEDFTGKIVLKLSDLK